MERGKTENSESGKREVARCMRNFSAFVGCFCERDDSRGGIFPLPFFFPSFLFLVGLDAARGKGGGEREERAEERRAMRPRASREVEWEDTLCDTCIGKRVVQVDTLHIEGGHRVVRCTFSLYSGHESVAREYF